MKPSSGAVLAILSALLFGASTPFAKLVLGRGVNAWLLAGLLYLGSGCGLGLVYALRRAIGRGEGEASLARSDMPWLALVILCGGGIAPVLLMTGLATTLASTASLLLNLEGLATLAIAWLVFRENVRSPSVGRRCGDPRRRGVAIVAWRSRGRWPGHVGDRRRLPRLGYRQ